MADLADVLKVEIALDQRSWLFNPTWTDITSLVYELRVERGRQNGPGTPFVPGRCTVSMRNNDGAWDPSNPSGTAWGKRIRDVQFRVRCASSPGGAFTGAVFSGFVETVAPQAGTHEAMVTLTATDGLRVLAQTELAGVTAARELTGHRARRVMVASGVKSEWVGTMHRGEVMMRPEELNGSALSHVQNAEATEAGVFLVDAAGQFHFRRRHAVVLRPQWATSQVTFAEVGTVGKRWRYGLVPVTTGEWAWWANRVTVGDFEASIAEFLDLPVTKSISNARPYWDADAAGLAAYWLDVWTQEAVWPQEIDAFVWDKGATSELAGSTHNHVLGHVHDGDLELMNRVTVKWTPKGHGTQLTSDCTVERLSHFASAATQQWTVRVALSAWSLLGTPSDLAGDKTAVQPGWIRLGVDDVSVGNNRTWAY